MSFIKIKLPFDKIYVDLIEQYIQLLVIFILYYLLEKEEKFNFFKLILYVFLGLLFNKLILKEIISFQ